MQVSREENTLIESMTPEEASGRFKAFGTLFAQRSYLGLWSAVSLLGCYFWSNESKAIIVRPCGEQSLSLYNLKANWLLLWTLNVIWLWSNYSEHSAPCTVCLCDHIHLHWMEATGVVWQISNSWQGFFFLLSPASDPVSSLKFLWELFSLYTLCVSYELIDQLFGL